MIKIKTLLRKGQRMKKIAYLFSGQGAQYPGMGKDLFEHHAEVMEPYFETAEKVLGYDLKAMCFEENDLLNQTEYTQAAIYTVSLAILAVWRKLFPENPAYLAGLSLGEYTALAYSGVFSFVDGLKLLRKRGLYMSQAVAPGQGKMLAVMKTDRKLIERVCENIMDHHSGYVYPTNYNSPKQIVIGGNSDLVDLARDELKEAGAKRLIPLKVSGPFHTQLMHPASLRLAQVLKDVEFSSQDIPVVANTSGQVHEDGEIKQDLLQQIQSPVKWADSIDYLIQAGVDTFIEIGPGKTLTSFTRQIDKSVTALNIEDEATLNKALTILQGD